MLRLILPPKPVTWSGLGLGLGLGSGLGLGLGLGFGFGFGFGSGLTLTAEAGHLDAADALGERRGVEGHLDVGHEGGVPVLTWRGLGFGFGLGLGLGFG